MLSIEELEADIARCEDYLNSSPPPTARAGSSPLHRRLSRSLSPLRRSESVSDVHVRAEAALPPANEQDAPLAAVQAGGTVPEHESEHAQRITQLLADRRASRRSTSGTDEAHPASPDAEEPSAAQGFAGLLATLEHQSNPLFELGGQSNRNSTRTNFLFELAGEPSDAQEPTPQPLATEGSASTTGGQEATLDPWQQLLGEGSASRIPRASRASGSTDRAQASRSLGRTQQASRIPRPLPRRLQALAAPRVHFWQQCATQRMEAEDAQIQACTFRPASSLQHPSPAQGPGHPGRRRGKLHEQLPLQRQQFQALRKELEAAELQECTFRPQLHSRARRSAARSWAWEASGQPRLPLHERLAHLQTLRRQKQAAAERVAGLEGCSFRPSINAQSRQMAWHNAVSRAVPSCALLARRLPPDGLGAGDRELEACTFAPAISSASRAMTAGSLQLHQDFLARQNLFIQSRRARLDQLCSEAEKAQCTFMPVLTARQPLSDKGNCMQSTAEPAAKPQRQRPDHLAEYTFQPALNPRSLQLASGRSIAELADISASTQARAECCQRWDNYKLQDCTFHPQINRRPVPLGSDGIQGSALQVTERLTAGAQEALHARAVALDRLKDACDSAELQQCTFVPVVHALPPPSSQTIQDVHGLATFLERKKLASKQQEELQQRAEKVFYLCPRTPKKQPTKPQPFRLRTEAGKAEDGTHRARPAGDSFSFQPQTVERHCSTLLSQIAELTLQVQE